MKGGKKTVISSSLHSKISPTTSNTSSTFLTSPAHSMITSPNQGHGNTSSSSSSSSKPRQPASSSVLQSSYTSLKQGPYVKRALVPEELMHVDSICKRMQLRMGQDHGILIHSNRNYSEITPFTNWLDAFNRLSAYHVLQPCEPDLMLAKDPEASLEILDHHADGHANVVIEKCKELLERFKASQDKATEASNGKM